MATTVTPEDALAAHLGRARSVLKSSASVTRPENTSPADSARHLGPGFDTNAITELKPQRGHKRYRRLGIAAAGVALVVLVLCFLGARFDHPKFVSAGSAAPVDGLTIFAVFFVAALAIERLMEPFSDAILPTADYAADARNAMRIAGTQTAAFALGDASRRNPAIHGGEPAPGAASPGQPNAEDVNKTIKNAADTAEKLSVRQLARTTLFWVIATCAGMFAAASMNLYFLSTVGIATSKPWWAEVLATGLIIGGGTKPLHDLVKLISKSAESQAAGGLDA